MENILVAMMGLCIGSFLNVCIYRLPKNMSVLGLRSPINLISVVSDYLRKGHFHMCRMLFFSRYALVELITAVLFVWCYHIFGLSVALLQALILMTFLIVITFIDYDQQLILDKVLILLAVIGLGLVVVIDAPNILDRLAACLAGGALMLLIAVVSRGGIGGGDIKFVAALGLWLGLKYTILTLFISFVLSGLLGAVILLLKLKDRKDFIPFGPFIAAGALISLLYGEKIITWYVNSWNT